MFEGRRRGEEEGHLPVAEILADLRDALVERPRCLLAAPPGSGKTTLVPPSLLANFPGRQVLVVEPRRLAARWAARRAAELLGEGPGRTVGWHVRLERVGGSETSLWYLTEGMLIRRLLQDPLLSGVGLVVLDEFHERNLAGDLCLAWLLRLQQGPRPDLRVLVMSATICLETLARALDAPALESRGRRHQVAIHHEVRRDSRPLSRRVAEAVQRAVEAEKGDLLVFLPGGREIREAMEATRGLGGPHDLQLEALHGEMSLAAQDRALAPGPKRKVVFSTNVAESSLTVPGVSAVVDAGLVRRATWDPWTGILGLEVGPAARNSLTQRAGRAGRTGPGTCWRLFSQEDFDSRPEEDPPEVIRADLAEAVLWLRLLGVRGPGDLPWLTPPPEASWRGAEDLLRRLRLLEPSGALSPLGTQVARLPLHPRLGVLVAEAGRRGDLALGCGMAVLLSERALRRPFDPTASAGGVVRAPCPDPVEEALSRWGAEGEEGEEDEGGGALPGKVGRESDLSQTRPRLARPERLDVLYRDLFREASRLGLRGKCPSLDRGTLGSRVLLAAFPDRLTRVRRSSADSRDWEFVWPFGGATRVRDDGSFREGFYVVPEAWMTEDPVRLRVGSARRVEDEDWLEVLLDDLRETREVRWRADGERVEERLCLWHGDLLLEERPVAALSPEAEDLLVRQALAAGLTALARPEEDPEGFFGRVAHAAALRPDLGWPALDGAWREAAVRQACRGCRSLPEVRQRGMLRVFLGLLTEDQRAALQRLAPEEVRLPGGRRLRVRWRIGEPPSVASRVQDFFGMDRGPVLPDGGGPIRLHLQNPRGLDLQVTSDLASFWRDHYPALAREMRRRYPRHAWPEDPQRATPPGPGRTR